MKHLKYFENKEEKEEKVLFLIFIIKHNDDVVNSRWIDALKTFRSLDVDWWVKPQNASHLGLAYQSILNTSDINDAEKNAEYIQSQFDFPILICLSKQSISKHEPVGESNDKGWWSIGKEFDKMVSNGTKDIYVI
jgi:hypothetical protein